jgi:hypothetical protein
VWCRVIGNAFRILIFVALSKFDCAESHG